jgi:hypothetical protein
MESQESNLEPEVKLTPFQREIIIEYFFKNNLFSENIHYRGIAEQLIDKGNVIVAAVDKTIWVGGIGNFIKTSKAENAVGCTLYEFDLASFLSSAWLKETCKEYLIPKHEGYVEECRNASIRAMDNLADIYVLIEANSIPILN